MNVVIQRYNEMQNKLSQFIDLERKTDRDILLAWAAREQVKAKLAGILQAKQAASMEDVRNKIQNVINHTRDSAVTETIKGKFGDLTKRLAVAWQDPATRPLLTAAIGSMVGSGAMLGSEALSRRKKKRYLNALLTGGVGGGLLGAGGGYLHSQWKPEVGPATFNADKRFNNFVKQVTNNQNSEPVGQGPDTNTMVDAVMNDPAAYQKLQDQISSTDPSLTGDALNWVSNTPLALGTASGLSGAVGLRAGRYVDDQRNTKLERILQDHVADKAGRAWYADTHYADWEDGFKGKLEKNVNDIKSRIRAAEEVMRQRGVLDNAVSGVKKKTVGNAKDYAKRTNPLEELLNNGKASLANRQLKMNIPSPQIQIPNAPDMFKLKEELASAENILKGFKPVAKRPSDTLEHFMEAARKKALEDPQLQEGRDAIFKPWLGREQPLQPFLNTRVTDAKSNGHKWVSPPKRTLRVTLPATLGFAAAPYAISYMFGTPSDNGEEAIRSSAALVRDYVESQFK